MIKLDLSGFYGAHKTGTDKVLYKGGYRWRWSTGYWVVLEKHVAWNWEKLVDVRRDREGEFHRLFEELDKRYNELNSNPYKNLRFDLEPFIHYEYDDTTGVKVIKNSEYSWEWGCNGRLELRRKGILEINIPVDKVPELLKQLNKRFKELSNG